MSVCSHWLFGTRPEVEGEGEVINAPVVAHPAPHAPADNAAGDAAGDAGDAAGAHEAAAAGVEGEAQEGREA
jgi:hypothetical protein